MKGVGRVLVTGVNGFVGGNLAGSLCQQGFSVVGTSRQPAPGTSAYPVIDDLDVRHEAGWSDALTGVDTVVHCAAVSGFSPARGQEDQQREQLFLINTESTLRLARQAADSGVRRFIFISSTKVNGERTTQAEGFSEDSPAAPQSDYARSKLDAENGLRALSEHSELDIVIVRLPPLYGIGMKGNLRSLMRLSALPVPLPFSNIRAGRSLLSVDNLSSFIAVTISHPGASNELFVVADRESPSTGELVAGMRRGLGRKPWLFPAPWKWVHRMTQGTPLHASVGKLVDPVRINTHKAERCLGWRPPLSFADAIARAVESNENAPDDSEGLSLPLLRLFDIVFSVFGLVVLSPFFIVLTVIGWLDTGSPFFRQERIGRSGKSFTLIKYRTMKPGTSSVATHLAEANAITRTGRYLRATKLDELPQLWNVLWGDMSLVGPRPSLTTQYELIRERESRGALRSRPGITGLAQINGVDMSNPRRLARVDSLMVRQFSLRMYLCIIVKTVLGRGMGDKVIRLAR